MKNKILSICIGTNNGNLSGSNNDSILFYNFLNKLYKLNKFNEYWLKPFLISDDNLFIKEICSKIKESDLNFKYLLIFYSGHGYKEGTLNIMNDNYTRINDMEFIKNISDSINQDIDLYIILDSCFGGSFKMLPYQNIKKINLIASTQYNQEASEGITTIEQIKKIFNKLEYSFKLDMIGKSLVMGIFTYNIVYLLNKFDFYSINEWYEIFDEENSEKIWNRIQCLANQKPLIIWNNKTINQE